MAGIMYLGNQMVSPVILQGESGGGFIGVPTYSVENGKLIKTNVELSGNEFDGIEDIDNTLFKNKYTSTQLSGVVGFGDLKKVGKDGLSYTFTNTNITSARFPELTEIGESGFDHIFSSSANFTNLELPSLEKIGDYGLEGFLWGTQVLEIHFPNLYDLDSESPFFEAFAETILENVYFNGLRESSFSGEMGEYVFEDMCMDAYPSDVLTLHFPSNLEDTISTLYGYPTFGGNPNKVVLAFDLTPTES